MRKSKVYSIDDLKKIGKEIRREILKISYCANVGHIGSALSIVDILTVLYFSILRINPKNKKADSRDRFILSKGHAAPALYTVLQKAGFFSKKKLYSYCLNGGTFGSHPDYNHNLGIELTTGSLGHGLSVGIGMAITAKIDKKNNRVFVLVSDAELNEGSIWEGIMFAGHHQLDNLTVLVDDNGQQAFGKTKDVLNLQPLNKKWEVFGWATKVIDGHDYNSLFKTLLNLPFWTGKPNVVIAKTICGKGVSFMENKIEWHYSNLSKKQYHQALKEI